MVSCFRGGWTDPFPIAPVAETAPGRGLSRKVVLTDQTRSGHTGDVIVKNISEAKTQFSALIEEVRKGREVLIAKAGKPVARLSRYAGAAQPRKPGALRGKIVIAPDFDELPEDLQVAFGMSDR